MGINSFTPGTQIKSGSVNENWNNFTAHGRWITLEWHFVGTLSAGTMSKYIILPDDVTFERVNLVTATGPTGDDLIVDIDKSTDNGGSFTTIFTDQNNRPQIDAGSRVGNTTTIDVNIGTGNSHIYRATIDQVGSTIAGADLVVTLIGKFNLD